MVTLWIIYVSPADHSPLDYFHFAVYFLYHVIRVFSGENVKYFGPALPERSYIDKT
jgi:hypothetical protein